MKYFKFLVKRTSICVLLLFTLLQNCKNNDCTEAPGDDFPYNCDGGMDVAFAIDYTGSMGTAINGIKSSLPSIISTIVTESGGDYRLSLSIFDEQQKAGGLSPYITSADYTSLPASQKIINTTGTTTNQYLTVMEKFSMANSTTFATQLSKLNASMSIGSGVSTPEPGSLLLNEVIKNNFAGAMRFGKTKFVIIITDAQDGGDDDAANTIDDTYLTNLANYANANAVQIILVSTLAGSNYELKLINAFPENKKTIVSNFNSIATDINNIIKNSCDSNTKQP